MFIVMKNYIVKNVSQLTDDTVLLTLRPKRSRDVLGFEPGQYAALGFKYKGRPSVVRCFSIVSSPNNVNELQFAVRVYGDFTKAVAELVEGDKVFIRGPFGEFVVDHEIDKNIILLAGGIGVTPFISMARTLNENNSTLPVTLLYSNQDADTIPFKDELISLGKANPYFKTAFFVTRGEIPKVEDNLFLKGRINEQVLKKLTSNNFNKFTYFICGPSGFTENMKQMLLDNNTYASRIITEEFTPSASIEAISNGSRFSISKLTYGFSAAALILAILFISGLDLVRSVPKLVSADSSQSTSKAQTTNSVTNQNVNSATSVSNPYTSGSSTATTNASSGSSTAATNNSNQTNSQSYSQPVTSQS